MEQLISFIRMMYDLGKLEVEIFNPTVYILDDDIVINFYTANSNSKDYKNKYSFGQSKGRRLGLEEANYIGYKF
jgi:hypothetical protein